MSENILCEVKQLTLSTHISRDLVENDGFRSREADSHLNHVTVIWKLPHLVLRIAD